MCVCVCLCGQTRIVSRDKILRFKNTLIKKYTLISSLVFQWHCTQYRMVYCEEYGGEKKIQLLVAVIIIIIDRFYIALFSALEQTHRAIVACNSG